MYDLSLMAVVTDAPDAERTIDIAGDIARRCQAHARVVSFVPVSVSVAAPTFAGAGLSAAMWQDFDAHQDAVDAKTEALVADSARRLGLSPDASAVASLTHVPIRETCWSTLMSELALVDFVVIAQSSVTGEGPWSGPLDEVLMMARTPVLVARSNETAAGRPAAIAWDGSLEAGRAIRAAVPILRDASWVTILQATANLDTRPKSAADPDRVTDYLSRRGIAVKDVVRVGGSKIGPALLSAAKGADAGLLVAGAYHHSRLREALFGGATQSFLADGGGPHLLIAH